MMMIFFLRNMNCFLVGFDVNESLDVGFCIEYESFSFDPIISDPILEPPKSEFLESETFVPMTVDLEQTLVHSNAKRLVDFGPTDLPRQRVHDDKISR